MSRPTSARVRLLALTVLVAVVAGGCFSGTGQQVSLSLPNPRAALLSSFLTGLDKPGIDAYIANFRTATDIISLDSTNIATAPILDPHCPLQYDYQTMSATRDWPGTGGPTANNGLFFGSTLGNAGFYNPARQEVLLVLVGSDLPPASGGAPRCYSTSKDTPSWAQGTPAYLPVRLDLRTGTWAIEGFASPGATINITSTSAFAMAALDDSGKISDGNQTLISPLRLNRFQVTDENFLRVMSYASVRDYGGAGRHIVWLRQADIAPSYARFANGSCTPAFFAFWGNKGTPNGGDWPQNNPGTTCQDQALDLVSDTSNHLDDFARMSGGSGSVDILLWHGGTAPVWQREADDNGKGSNAAGNAVAEQLTKLVTTTDPAARAAIVAELQKVMDGYPGMTAASKPPDSMGGWTALQPDVFGVIVSNGNNAYLQTKNYLNDTAAFGAMRGYVGVPATSSADTSGLGRSGQTFNVSISPSFQYRQVSDTSAATAAYNQNSTLLNPAGLKYTVMPFSTEAATSGAGGTQVATGVRLGWSQSPLNQFSINVQDSLQRGHESTYISTWLPMMALPVNGPASAVKHNYSLLTNPQAAIPDIIYGFFYDVYRSTVGAWMGALARATTQNMLAMPTLDKYEIAYYDRSNQPVYVLNTKNFAANDIAAAKTKNPDVMRCTGLLADSARSAAGLTPDITGSDPCFKQNDLNFLWTWMRALMTMLIFFLMARYAVSLMRSRREGDDEILPPLGFIARVALVFGLVFYLDWIIKALGSLVAETIVITNLIGTQVAGGAPYSHLWLFSTFLSDPTRDANVLALFGMAVGPLIGMLMLMITSYIRIGLTVGLILISPLWIVSLMTERNMKTFLKTVVWALQLYLVPMMTLVVLLLLSVFAKAINFNPANGGGLAQSVLALVLMLAAIALPIFFARLIARPVARVVRSGLSNFTAWSDDQKRNRWMRAVGSELSLNRLSPAEWDDQTSTPSSRISAARGGNPDVTSRGEVPATATATAGERVGRSAVPRRLGGYRSSDAAVGGEAAALAEAQAAQMAVFGGGGLELSARRGERVGATGLIDERADMVVPGSVPGAAAAGTSKSRGMPTADGLNDWAAKGRPTALIGAAVAGAAGQLEQAAVRRATGTAAGRARASSRATSNLKGNARYQALAEAYAAAKDPVRRQALKADMDTEAGRLAAIPNHELEQRRQEAGAQRLAALGLTSATHRLNGFGAKLDGLSIDWSSKDTYRQMGALALRGVVKTPGTALRVASFVDPTVASARSGLLGLKQQWHESDDRGALLLHGASQGVSKVSAGLRVWSGNDVFENHGWDGAAIYDPGDDGVSRAKLSQQWRGSRVRAAIAAEGTYRATTHDLDEEKRWSAERHAEAAFAVTAEAIADRIAAESAEIAARRTISTAPDAAAAAASIATESSARLEARMREARGGLTNARQAEALAAQIKAAKADLEVRVLDQLNPHVQTGDDYQTQRYTEELTKERAKLNPGPDQPVPPRPTD